MTITFSETQTCRYCKRPLQMCGGEEDAYCPHCLYFTGSVFDFRRKKDCTLQAIRAHARRVIWKYGSYHQCVNCQTYSGLEVCHIIPISEFPAHALIPEINSPYNLVWLCRNCHWLLDNRSLEIQVKKGTYRYFPEVKKAVRKSLAEKSSSLGA